MDCIKEACSFLTGNGLAVSDKTGFWMIFLLFFAVLPYCGKKTD